MMIENKITDFLSFYNYKYINTKNSIIVDLGQKLLVNLRIKDDGTLLVEECLKGWNPVTGFVDLTIKKAMIFNTIGLVIALILSELSKIPDYFYEYDFTYLLMIFIAINFMWLFYYLIRFESFKIKLELLMKDYFEKKKQN